MKSKRWSLIATESSWALVGGANRHPAPMDLPSLVMSSAKCIYTNTPVVVESYKKLNLFDTWRLCVLEFPCQPSPAYESYVWNVREHEGN